MGNTTISREHIIGMSQMEIVELSHGYEGFLKFTPEARGKVSERLYREVSTFITAFLRRVTNEIPDIKNAKRAPDYFEKGIFDTPVNLMLRSEEEKTIEKGHEKMLRILDEMLGKSTSNGANLLKKLFETHPGCKTMIVNEAVHLFYGWCHLENYTSAMCNHLFHSALTYSPETLEKYNDKCVIKSTLKILRGKKFGTKKYIKAWLEGTKLQLYKTNKAKFPRIRRPLLP